MCRKPPFTVSSVVTRWSQGAQLWRGSLDPLEGLPTISMPKAPSKHPPNRSINDPKSSLPCWKPLTTINWPQFLRSRASCRNLLNGVDQLALVIFAQKRKALQDCLIHIPAGAALTMLRVGQSHARPYVKCEPFENLPLEDNYLICDEFPR